MKNRTNDEDFAHIRKLTHSQVLWLIANYHNLTNEECAERLNLKPKTLINYAFKLDLRKSPYVFQDFASNKRLTQIRKDGKSKM